MGRMEEVGGGRKEGIGREKGSKQIGKKGKAEAKKMEKKDASEFEVITGEHLKALLCCVGSRQSQTINTLSCVIPVRFFCADSCPPASPWLVVVVVVDPYNS